MAINFKSFNPTTDIYKPGVLRKLAEDIGEEKPTKDYRRLTINEFATLPAMYGCLEPQELDIVNLEGEIKTLNDKVICAEDLQAITEVMYMKPRTAYLDPGKNPQTKQSNISGAVPTAMLGIKRGKNVAYSRWFNAVKDEIIFDPNELEAGIVNFKPKDEDSLRKVFKIDLLLGKTLASTIYDPQDGCIKWGKEFGLVVVSSLTGYPWAKNFNDHISYFRVEGMGNYKGHYSTQYGAASLAKNSIPPGIHPQMVDLYNKCSNPMRLLLAQRWVWYPQHRSSDMICDFTNWDSMPESSGLEMGVETYKPVVGKNMFKFKNEVQA